MEAPRNINIITTSENTEIDSTDIPLTDLLLPGEWVLYLYNKQIFKKVAKDDIKAQPYKPLCTITTVNDVIYLLQLMKLKPPFINAPQNKSVNSTPNTSQPRAKPPQIQNVTKLNLDMNDYIIMRKGIEPIWEDPKNKNGGTFTVITDHQKGYDVWEAFIIYMLGETLTEEMSHINGISVSYISDLTNQNSTGNKKGSTYIKIWDGKLGRSDFMAILPEEITQKIKNDSIRYARNNTKNDYNESNIFSKLTTDNTRSRGGFNQGGFRKGGGGGRGRGNRQY